MTNNQLTILLVEDNDQLAGRLCDMLLELPHVVEVVRSASYEEAKMIFAERIFHIVLLDIHLPGTKSGIDLLKYFKEPGRPCRVIMISNQASEYHKRHCLALGADHFIDKTIDLSKLPGVIKKMKNQIFF